MSNKHEKSTSSTFHNLSTKISTFLLTESNENNNNLAHILVKNLHCQVLQVKRSSFQRIKNNRKDKQNEKYSSMYKSMPPDMLMFANHCATIIQSHFRGYQQRKYYSMFKPILRRFKEFLSAIVAGWRVRRLLNTRYINKKKTKITAQLNKKNFREVRILKRDLIDDMNGLLKKGKWLLHYKQDQKIKQKAKTKITNTMLRSVSLLHQPKSNENQSKSVMVMPKNKSNNNLKQQKINKQQQFIQNQVQSEHRQQTPQIPIKSTGFYNIPGVELINQQFQTTKVKKKQSKKINLQIKKKQQIDQKSTVKNQSSRTATVQLTTKDNLKLQQPKQKNNLSKSLKKQQKTQIMPIKVQSTLTNNLSLLSLNFPIENDQINQITGNKTTKIQSRIHQTIRNQLQQTQKLKKSQRRGIKVTLSLNSSTRNIQNKQTNQSISIKYTNSNPLNSIPISNPTNNLNPVPHSNLNLKKMEPQKTKDGLQEILEVYNNAYAKKKQQITKKMQQINKKRKFVA